MWDKGQMIVISSRMKFAKDTIFVGDKDDTLEALKRILIQKTQWTDISYWGSFNILTNNDVREARSFSN